MKVILLLWSKHVCLQKVNQEYFISNNFSSIITGTVITQTENNTVHPVLQDKIQLKMPKFDYKQGNHATIF